ncbi:hypothetical protein [Sphingobium sp.]|uniref:hypothetical protein n=1 Tax=Sphingobium sp. TaxID=1912891 RepID=UPI003B3A961D
MGNAAFLVTFANMLRFALLLVGIGAFVTLRHRSSPWLRNGSTIADNHRSYRYDDVMMIWNGGQRCAFGFPWNIVL